MGSIVEQDLKDLFSPYGELKRCEIKGRGQFAFVNFVEERDAERAHRALQDTEIRGARINIEWARGSGRYESRRSELVCYECREPGHFARDCRRARYRSPRRRYRSRSRSPPRYRYRRSRSPRSPRRRYRERSYSRSRSPDSYGRSYSRSPRSPRRERERERDMSTSPRRERDSRSPPRRERDRDGSRSPPRRERDSPSPPRDTQTPPPPQDTAPHHTQDDGIPLSDRKRPLEEANEEPEAKKSKVEDEIEGEPIAEEQRE